MASGMIELIKIAAMEAIENGKPCDLRFGTVVSISPLKVSITSDFILPEALLIVPRHLNSGGLNVSVIDDTLYIKSVVATVSDEGVSESNTLTTYNGLKVGDNVVLLRNHGGTKYLILDRI